MTTKQLKPDEEKLYGLHVEWTYGIWESTYSRLDNGPLPAEVKPTLIAISATEGCISVSEKCKIWVTRN